MIYLKLRNNDNSVLKKYFKNYCQILTKVIKEAKRMEYDRHISNSTNIMRTSWNLINKEFGRDCKNYGVKSLNINGRSITNHKIIANALNNHFTTFLTMICQKINANNCVSFNITSDNNQNNISFSLNQVYQNSFPNI